MEWRGWRGWRDCGRVGGGGMVWTGQDLAALPDRAGVGEVGDASGPGKTGSGRREALSD